MELRDLRYFLAAVEAGSLTAAARHVHAAQPTLSHAIARLEAEAGEPLLARAANRRSGVRPTPAGACLARRARRIFAEADGFHADVADLKGLLAGEVTIGAVQSLNVTLLPGPLARFAARHPAVHIRSRSHRLEDLPRELRSGRCDIALVAGIPAADLEGCERHLLMREVFVVIVRRDDPLARNRRIPLSRLKESPWLTVLAGTYTRRLLDEACQLAGFIPRVTMELESGETLRETVRAGLGLTVLPAGYLRDDDPDLVAIPLSAPVPERAVEALLPTDRPVSHATRAFLDELRR